MRRAVCDLILSLFPYPAILLSSSPFHAKPCNYDEVPYL